jgi:hypothetical protein
MLQSRLPCTFQTLIDFAYTLKPDLKTFCETNALSLRARDKGNVGKLVEFHLFGRLPNNDSAPDLGPEYGDLKATHIKRTRLGWSAKERLTLTNCGSTSNYETLQHLLVDMHECRLYPKLRKGLLFVFEHSKTPLSSVYEETVAAIVPYDIEALPEDVRGTLQADYAAIQERVRTQTVSQSGQSYLHIHPHGSKGSSTRALGFTNKFLTYLIAKGLGTELMTKGRSTYFQRTDDRSPHSSSAAQEEEHSGPVPAVQIG